MRFPSICFSLLIVVSLFAACKVRHSMNSSAVMDSASDEIKKIEAQYHFQNKVAIVGGQTIRILTYNIGLLWAKTASVPNYNERRENVFKYFSRTINDALESKPQIIFLQELWYGQDAKLIMAGMSSLGYVPALQDTVDTNHGLQIFVQRSFMAPNTELRNVHFHQFNSYGNLEYMVSYLRGHLTAEMTAVDGSKILLCAAHLSAGLGLTQVRIEQATELANTLSSKAQSFDYVVAGADFNASPTFSNAPIEEEADWTRNIQTYLSFANSASNFRDTYLAVNNDDGFTQDRVNNPLAKFSSSTKDEPEQRIDYIWFGSTKKPFRVVTSTLYFTDYLTDQSGNALIGTDPKDTSKTFKLHMSDHFGVFTEIQYQK